MSLTSTHQLQLLIVNIVVNAVFSHARALSKAMPKRRRPILIGSDCSGIGTDAVAVERLGVPFKNLFASDVDAHCRKVLK